MVLGPRLGSLQEIVGYCEENDVVAAAIDAQLTTALSWEDDYRTSDLHPRKLLSKDCKTWVA